MAEPEMITGETCPICNEKALTLMESEQEIPYFGVCVLFSMNCGACKYHKADVEGMEKRKRAKYTLTIDSEEDLQIRVVKSSNAKVKIGSIGSMEPGEAANGYVTNVEGLLNRIKKQIEHLRDVAQDEGDAAAAKKARNHLKKLTRVMWGQEPIKIVVDDPTGNSAIISEKAEKA